MIIFLGISFTLSYIVLVTLMKKRERNEPCEKSKPYKPSKQEVLLVKMMIISLAMILLSCIAMGVTQALGADSDTSTLYEEYIPVKSGELKVYVTESSEVYFDDGEGICYWIPKNTATVETFPDSKLKITSIKKITQRKTPSRIIKFLSDFGIFSGDDGEIIKTYELSVPESKVIPITPASEAFSVQIAVPFEES